MRYIFLQYMHAQPCKFQNSFVWKPEHTNPLDAEPETDNATLYTAARVFLWCLLTEGDTQCSG